MMTYPEFMRKYPGADHYQFTEYQNLVGQHSIPVGSLQNDILWKNKQQAGTLVTPSTGMPTGLHNVTDLESLMSAGEAQRDALKAQLNANTDATNMDWTADHDKLAEFDRLDEVAEDRALMNGDKFLSGSTGITKAGQGLADMYSLDKASVWGSNGLYWDPKANKFMDKELLGGPRDVGVGELTFDQANQQRLAQGSKAYTTEEFSELGGGKDLNNSGLSGLEAAQVGLAGIGLANQIWGTGKSSRDLEKKSINASIANMNKNTQMAEDKLARKVNVSEALGGGFGMA